MFAKRCRSTTSRRPGRALLLVGGCLIGGLVPANAQAALLWVVEPQLPATVHVGDVAEGQLIVANGSKFADSSALLRLQQATLVTSCGGEARHCFGAESADWVDQDAITIAPTPTPFGAHGCAGSTFPATVGMDPAGIVNFTPSGEVVLSTVQDSTCAITFRYTVQNVPMMDSNPAIAGTQTDVIGSAKGYTTPGTPRYVSTDSTPTQITVDQAITTLTSETPAGVHVGDRLSATALLGGASHPGGSIVFRLYKPDQPTCATPMTTFAPVPVTANGAYLAPTVIATDLGTYRWTASYLGDVDNKPAQSACNTPGTTTLVSAPTPPPPPPPPAPGTTTPGGAGGSTPGTVTPPGGAGTTPGDSTPGTTTPNGTKIAAAVKRVRLDAFTLTRKTFARATTSTALAATAAYATAKKKKATKKGTTIKYTLSAPATVMILVERVTKGRRSGGHGNPCVKATKKLKKKKSCTLYVKVSALKRIHTTAGAKKVSFSGRAGRKALPVGRYRMRAGASAGTGTASVERRATFQIVKR
jgi:hypothetical protein